MGVETDQDLDVFTNPDEFGSLAVLKPSGRISEEIQGLYSAQTISGVDQFGSPVFLKEPVFTVRTADVENASAGDELQIVGKGIFTIVRIEPDESEARMSRLLLEVA